MNACTNTCAGPSKLRHHGKCTNTYLTAVIYWIIQHTRSIVIKKKRLPLLEDCPRAWSNTMPLEPIAGWTVLRWYVDSCTGFQLQHVRISTPLLRWSRRKKNNKLILLDSVEMLVCNVQTNYHARVISYSNLPKATVRAFSSTVHHGGWQRFAALLLSWIDIAILYQFLPQSFKIFIRACSSFLISSFF